MIPECTSEKGYLPGPVAILDGRAAIAVDEPRFEQRDVL